MKETETKLAFVDDLDVCVETTLTQDHIVDAAMVQYEEQLTAKKLKRAKEQSAVDDKIAKLNDKIIKAECLRCEKLCAMMSEDMIAALKLNGYKKIVADVQVNVVTHKTGGKPISYFVSYIEGTSKDHKGSAMLSSNSVQTVFSAPAKKLIKQLRKLEDSSSKLGEQIAEMNYELSAQRLAFRKRQIVAGMVSNILPRAGKKGELLLESVVGQVMQKALPGG